MMYQIRLVHLVIPSSWQEGKYVPVVKRITMYSLLRHTRDKLVWVTLLTLTFKFCFHKLGNLDLNTQYRYE